MNNAGMLRFGKLYRRLYRIRQTVLKLPDEKLTQIVASAATLDAHPLSLKDILRSVLKTQPELLVEVLPYFLGQ